MTKATAAAGEPFGRVEAFPVSDHSREGRMQTPTTFKRRLNELELRRRLRARPRLQGRILAPAGAFKRLPSTAGLYFPFYHDVPAEFAGDLCRHLRAFRQRGPMVSWD